MVSYPKIFSPQAPHARPRRDSILFVGLILLFILSLIGITSMRTTTQQERMSGNLRHRTVAFQAAELALAAAEKIYFRNLSIGN